MPPLCTFIEATDVVSASKDILRFLRSTRGDRHYPVIYLDGWDGFGASAILSSIAKVLPSMRTTPDLCFDRIIHLDCSEWKSRRAVQRALAEKLKLDRSVMAILDKQDDEDDFDGVEESRRMEVASVSRAIHHILKDIRLAMIFHNGSDNETDLTNLGVPLVTNFGDNVMIWTFKRKLLTIIGQEELQQKLSYTRLSVRGIIRHLSSEQFYAVLCKEIAIIVARHPCMRGNNPAMVADCCLYELFMHYSFKNNYIFDWACHASNYWMCDGIMLEDTTREISNAICREIRWECDTDQFGSEIEKFMKPHSFLVIKDGDDYPMEPCRRISITSRNLTTQNIQTIPSETSSLFLACEEYYYSPLEIPNGLFGNSSNLGVLVLSCCAFSFASPPFRRCHGLRFLGLENCKDNNSRQGECHTEWAWLNSLWVLDLRYTYWDEILSRKNMDRMTKLIELNIKGVSCWQYASDLHGRVPYLRRLRIINPTREPETSIDTSNSFLDKTNLEILDLSGNNEIKIIPKNLSKASSLHVLVLDGCNGLENVILPDGLLHLLRSFSFDGYGSAYEWAQGDKLPPETSRPPFLAHKEEATTSHISLQGCTLLENLFLRGLPNLVELDLSGTAIVALDFDIMVVGVPSLKRLFLLGCQYLRVIRWGWDSCPDLELLCIDTRAGIGSSRSFFDHNESFQLRVHAVIVDARFTRSLWPPMRCVQDVYFDINVTSSPVHSGVVQLEGAHKENIGPIDQVSKKQLVPADRYSDVFSMVDDAAMQAFPLPSTTKSDRHIEIAEGSHGLDCELRPRPPLFSYSRPMVVRAESLHVHDVSTTGSIPSGIWEYIRLCRMERCPKLGTVFPSEGLLYGCTSSFTKLQHLHLSFCPRLKFVIPVWVSSFPRLETLHIIHCGDLGHIFILDQSEEIEVHSIQFPKLTTIHLHNLPMLRKICEVKMVAPALETIRIKGCWGLRRLPTVANHGGDMKKPTIEIEKDVWDTLEWDGLEAGHHPDHFEAPIHSRYYKKKLARVSVLR